jgi:hypothetical protein
MLQGISNAVGSLPVASIACAATGLFIGRKFCTAAVYKAGSIGANFIESKNAAEWNQASSESLILAKKDGIRDLTAAAGLIAIGVASFTAQHAEEKVPQKEESGFFQDYGWPTLKGVCIFTSGWILKNLQVHRALKLTMTPMISANGKKSTEYHMSEFKKLISYENSFVQKYW